MIWQLAAWALGVGSGVAGRWARRHAAPAVVGRFIFFRDLAFFGDSEDSGFGPTTDDGRRTTDDGRTTKPGYPQTPIPRTENRQNFIAKIFFGAFKNRKSIGVAPLMAGQMPVVVVSGGWGGCRLAQRGGGGPPPSTTSPPFPPFISRHRSPSGVSESGPL